MSVEVHEDWEPDPSRMLGMTAQAGWLMGSNPNQAEMGWSHPRRATERRRKMARRREACVHRDLGDRPCGVRELDAGAVDATLTHVLARRAAVALPERTRQMHGMDAGLAGNGVQT